MLNLAIANLDWARAFDRRATSAAQAGRPHPSPLVLLLLGVPGWTTKFRRHLIPLELPLAANAKPNLHQRLAFGRHSDLVHELGTRPGWTRRIRELG